MMEPSDNHLLSPSGLQGLMAELDKALANVPDTQQQLMAISGVAWSPDGLIKAEVGPRGQLIDLEIDSRVFRQPDAQSLKTSIMSAVTSAVRQVNEQMQEIMFGQLPPEVAELRGQFLPEGDDPIAQMLRSDADLAAERRRGDASR